MSDTEQAPIVDLPADGHECARCHKTFKSAAGLAGHSTGCLARSLRKNKDTVPAEEAPKEPAKPRTPTPTPKQRGRRDASGLLGPIWGGAASFVVPTLSPAAAKGMALTTEAAGPILDQALAGTFVDRMILQKVTGKGEKAKGLGTLLGLPVLLMIIEKQPLMAKQPAVRSALKYTVTANFEAIVDARVAEKKKSDRLAAKAQEAGISLVMTDENGQQVDLIDALCDDLLSGIFNPAPVEAPDEA